MGFLENLLQCLNNVAVSDNLTSRLFKMFLRVKCLGENNVQVRKQLRQIIPVLCGYLLPMSFGMMWGWTSPAFPYLLQWNISVVPITLDSTAIIAGYLLGAQAVGSVFSNAKILDSKTGIICCALIHFFGWCVMVGVKDMYGIFISRVSIGIVNAYGTGQLKRYIKETCEPKLIGLLTSYIPIAIPIGVIWNYSIGACVSFRVMAVCSACVPACAAIIFGGFEKKTLKTQTSIVDILNNTNLPQTQPSGDYVKQANIIACFKDNQTRNALFLILWVAFIQQATGGAANVVYSHMIFSATNNYVPNLCSVIYALTFLVSTFSGITYAKNFNRKHNILLGCGMSTLTTGAMSMYYYMKNDLLDVNINFCWLPLGLLVVYNLFHTFGIATVPTIIIADKVPKFAKNVANKLLLFQVSIGAVVTTKAFQLLFSNYDMSMGYAFFSIAGFFGFVTILLFMDDYSLKLQESENFAKCDNRVSVIEVTRL